MDAIIHIGTEKTGSTSLQHFLAENRPQLAAQGILYPITPGATCHTRLMTYCLNNNRQDDSHVYMGLLDPERRRQWQQKFANELNQELTQASANGISTVIFSSELFHSRLTHPEEITALKALLSPYFDSIRVLIYLRRQDELAVSLYSTRLKYCENDAGYFNEQDPHSAFFNYSILLHLWAEVFGHSNINARVFSKTKLLQGDLIYDACQQLGINSQHLSASPAHNPSLNQHGQVFLARFNQHVPFYQQDKLNPARFGVIEAMEQLFSGPAGRPDRASAIDYYQAFSTSNQLVSEYYFNGEALFDDDFSHYPEQADDVAFDNTMLMDVAAKLWLIQKQQTQDKQNQLLDNLTEHPDLHHQLECLADYFAPEHQPLAKKLMDSALDQRQLSDKIKAKLQTWLNLSHST